MAVDTLPIASATKHKKEEKVFMGSVLAILTKRSQQGENV